MFERKSSQENWEIEKKKVELWKLSRVHNATVLANLAVRSCAYFGIVSSVAFAVNKMPVPGAAAATAGGLIWMIAGASRIEEMNCADDVAKKEAEVRSMQQQAYQEDQPLEPIRFSTDLTSSYSVLAVSEFSTPVHAPSPGRVPHPEVRLQSNF